MTVIIIAGAVGWYTVASYGWVLLKGYDIPFTEWISPLNPYQWPGKGPVQTIPAGKLFPSKKTAASTASTGGTTTLPPSQVS